MIKEKTPEEKELDNEFRLLIKRANQRILRLERLTGVKESFSVKQLIDYLSSSSINAVTSKGRISSKQNITLMQKQAIKKAVEGFLSSKESTKRGLKKYIEKVSKISGKKLDYKKASTYYQVTQDLSWLYNENISPSIFWRDFAQQVNNRSSKEWAELVLEYRTNVTDINLKQNLEQLYYYVKGE